MFLIDVLSMVDMDNVWLIYVDMYRLDVYVYG
jgi:hypothetical protein